MYDRVKFWIDVGAINRVEMGQISDRLHLNEQSAYLNNICVKSHNGSISGCGSLAKYFADNNLYTINREETEAIVEALSSDMGVNITGARITQMEFGTNFYLSSPISEYLNLFGSAPYSKRRETAVNCSSLETLSYQSNSKKRYFNHVLYDKGAEMGIDDNILRYELRYMRDISRYLKIKGGITLKTLYDRDFYDYMLNRYWTFYESIKKMSNVTISTESIKTVGDGVETLVAMLLNETTPNRIEQYINQLKLLQVYDDPKYYTRLKVKLNSIANRKGATENKDLIAELDREIRNACLLE